MEVFIAACLAVLVVEMSLLIAVLAAALFQIRKTAQAVEVLTYRVDHQVASFGENMRSGWAQAFPTLINLLGRYFFRG